VLYALGEIRLDISFYLTPKRASFLRVRLLLILGSFSVSLRLPHVLRIKCF
jgi:hypothetical protein